MLAEAWRTHRCLPLLSQEIFDEYLRVLTYPKFQLSSSEIKRVLEHDFLPYAEFVRVTSQVEVIAADPSDNKFLACALDGRADVVVSGDRHLLTLKRFHGIAIVTARQFRDQVASVPDKG